MSSLLQTLFSFVAPPQPVEPPKPPRRKKAPTTIQESQPLEQLFQLAYRELRPRAPMPAFTIRFRRFTSLNTTIRLRDGRLYVNLSDLLQDAPVSVHEAIAHILLAKLYRKPISRTHNDRYRRFSHSAEISKRTEAIRKQRGRKRILSAQGDVYDLEEIFHDLNARFFNNLLGQPVLTWSSHSARRLLGHYDAAHNTIMVSRVFDEARMPRFAVEYLLYHEMLHLKHPVSVRNGRRCVHSRAFQADEKLFPYFEEAKALLKRL